MDNERQYQIEGRAWRSVRRELEALGVKLNEHGPLCRALVRWGEELAELRDNQDKETVGKALNNARAAYPVLAED